MGALWRPLGLPHFLVCATRVLQWGSTKRQKQFKINGLGCFLGTLLRRPIWTIPTKNTFPCSVVLVLGFPTWAPSARGRTRRGLHESAPMQRGARFFPKKAFPCSAPLKVLSVTSAPARSRVTFSNTLGFVVFIVLQLWRSGALFFDNPWPSVAIRSIT